MDTMALLQNGGVQVMMITDDAEETMLSVASHLGYMAQQARELVRWARHSCAYITFAPIPLDNTSRVCCRESVLLAC